MTKILFNEKKIFLTDNYNDLLIDLKVDNAEIVFDLNKEKLLHSIDLLMISEIENAIFVGDETALLTLIKSSFKLIIAGGGLVKNNQNEILFIYRRGKWDLPKGKIEPNEDIESCAVREVMEETGLENLHIERPLAKTHHIYFEKEFIFKENYWYLMHSEDKILNPQLEEGIKKAVWINQNNIANPLRNTYESIKDIIAIVLQK